MTITTELQEIPEGWTAWEGGPRPPVPPGTAMRVMLRNHVEARPSVEEADHLDWEHHMGPAGAFDIIAYQVIPQDPQPAPAAPPGQDLIVVHFRPKEDITAFELATMLGHGWPVATHLGGGALMTTITAPRALWAQMSPAIHRHWQEEEITDG